MGVISNELLPSKDNLMLTLQKNLLGRNESLWYFAKFLNAFERSCSIAIDARWGEGKTFFVKQAIMLLDSLNPVNESLNKEEKDIVKKCFSKYESEWGIIKPELCIYYDAWENDNDMDPILSIVFEIIQAVKNCNPNLKGKPDFIKLGAEIFDSIQKTNIVRLMEILKTDDPLSEIQKERVLKERIGLFLKSVLEERGERLVLFIDELDRCKPSCAVQLLERVKHYFIDENITFVFSINSLELQHTIKRYYGEQFDATRYLDRFFNYQITLPQANLDNYYRSLGMTVEYYVFDEICRKVIRYYSLGIRETERYCHMMKMMDSKFLKLNKNNRSVSFYVTILTPIILGLKMTNTEQYELFLNGKYYQPVIEIYKDFDFIKGYVSSLLDREETFPEDAAENKKVVSVEDKLTQLYLMIFSDDGKDNNWSDGYIGECKMQISLERHVDSDNVGM